MVPLLALLLLAAEPLSGPSAPSAPPRPSPAAATAAASPSTAPTPAAPTKNVPASAAREILLVLDVGGDVIDERERSELGEALTLLLAERLDLEVQSSRTLKDRVALIAEQQNAGCDTSACLAELASAMGARFIVFGRVVVIGGDHVLRLEVFDDRSARTLALTTVQGDGVQALVKGLPDGVGALVAESAGELPARVTTKKLLNARAEPAFMDRPGANVVVGGLIATGAGLAVGGLGLWGMFTYNAERVLLDDALASYTKTPSLDNARAVAEVRDDIGSSNAHLYKGIASLGALAGGGLSLLIGAFVGAGGGLYMLTATPAEEP